MLVFVSRSRRQLKYFLKKRPKGKIQHFFQDFVHTIEIKHTMLFMPKILAPSTSSFWCSNVRHSRELLRKPHGSRHGLYMVYIICICISSYLVVIINLGCYRNRARSARLPWSTTMHPWMQHVVAMLIWVIRWNEGLSRRGLPQDYPICGSFGFLSSIFFLNWHLWDDVRNLSSMSTNKILGSKKLSNDD